MKTTRFLTISGSVLLLAFAGACEKKSAPANEDAPVKTETTRETSQQAKQQLTRVLNAYEVVRAQLAGDEIAATTASAEALERAAKEANSSALQKLRPGLQKLAAAAAQLKEMPKQDASEVRRSFGQVSEAVVALLSAEPSLREGRHLFECPMAQGYKKWVQTTEKISNPYMGTQMLGCGSATKWDS